MVQTEKISVTVNGRKTEVQPGTSIVDIVRKLNADPCRVVVERNREIVAGGAFPTTIVGENDEIEVIQFVGGG